MMTKQDKLILTGVSIFWAGVHIGRGRVAVVDACTAYLTEGEQK